MDILYGHNEQPADLTAFRLEFGKAVGQTWLENRNMIDRERYEEVVKIADHIYSNLSFAEERYREFADQGLDAKTAAAKLMLR